MYRICFCEHGVMSQCKAPSKAESIACWFYEKSTVAERCMYLCETINNHCDSHKAQDYGYHPPLESEFDVDLEEEEISLVAMAERADNSCVDCILYTCSHIIHEQQMAQPRGGLTHDDLCNIAKNCKDYDDEASMTARINQSLRGANP